MKTNNESRLNIRGILFAAAILLTGVFYFFVLGDSSYAMYADSETFIGWSENVALKDGYAVYINFLRTCRGLFGEGGYLQAVNIIQCTLALITSLVLEEYVRRYYKLGYMAGYISFLAVCGVYGYSLPEVVASHYIVTEGLTFPLFALMLVFLLRYINEHLYFYLVFVFGTCIVMASTRPQLLFFLPILLFIVLINEICLAINKRQAGRDTSDLNGNIDSKSGVSWWRRCGSLLVIPGVIVITIAGLYLVMAITTILFVKGVNSQYHEAVIGKILCVIKPEDVSLQEDELKEGYRLLYEDTYVRGGLAEDFPTSILEYEKVQLIIDDNMKSGLDIIWDWYNDHYEPLDRHSIHKIRNRIIAPELDAHRSEYIGVILRLMPASLVSSIFIQPPQYRLVCNLIALGLYLTAIALVYAAYYRGINRRYYMPLLISLIMIYGNALLSNIVLYGQQRYVVYCFGIFYVSLLIVIRGIMTGRTVAMEATGVYGSE